MDCSKYLLSNNLAPYAKTILLMITLLEKDKIKA